MQEPCGEAGDGEVVTKIVDRIPRPGEEAALEQAIRDLIAAAVAFPGHLGVTVTRPAPPQQPGFRIVYRFDSCEHLAAWETSASYARLAAIANRHTQGEPTAVAVPGLEAWLSLPAPSAPVSRARLAVVSWLGIFPLVTLAGWAAGLLLPGTTPWPLRAALVTAVVVPAMTYVVAPGLTRLFGRWLAALPPPR